MSNRRAAYTNDAMTDERGDHFVALVDEHVPGYTPTTYTGTLDYCEGVVTAINDALGVDPEDALAIVSSTMPGAVTR